MSARAKSEQHPIFRAGGISYLHIPAPQPPRSAAFYEAVFGWSIRDDGDSFAFEDGTGHVIGHFLSNDAVAGDAGIRPYIFVDSVQDTLDKVMANGGDVVRSPYAEGNLLVATVHDPAGNLIGIWQRSPGT
jgi:uncharacterized protein